MRIRKAQRDHVEIELFQPLLVEREIGHALVDLNAELLEVARVRCHDAAHGAAIVEHLEDERLALAVAQRAVRVRPAGLRQQATRLPQVGWPELDRGGSFRRH
nr:hypothetical protein [Salmonella enterica]